MTPYLLMLGRENRLPFEIILGQRGISTGKPVTSYGAYLAGLRDHMQKAHDIARKYLGKNAVRMKESYDGKPSLIHI